MSDTVYSPNIPGTSKDNDDVVVSGTVATLLQANVNRRSALILDRKNTWTKQSLKQSS